MPQCFDDCLWIKNIAILNVEGVDYRCILWGISKNEAASWNKTPAEVIKEGAFEGT